MGNPKSELRLAKNAFDEGDLERLLDHIQNIDDSIERDCTSIRKHIENELEKDQEKRDELLTRHKLDRIENWL